MYSPELREDQLHKLYLLRKIIKKPMTKILRQIVDEYLEAHKEELQELETIAATITQLRRVI